MAERKPYGVVEIENYNLSFPTISQFLNNHSNPNVFRVYGVVRINFRHFRSKVIQGLNNELLIFVRSFEVYNAYIWT